MSRRGYTCAVGLLGTLAFACLLVGFIAPGWIVMKRSLEEIDIPMDLFVPPWRRQPIDDGGLGGEPIDDGGMDSMLNMDRRQAMGDMMDGDHMPDSEHRGPGEHMRPENHMMDEEQMRMREGRNDDWSNGNMGMSRQIDNTMENWARNGFGLAQELSAIQMKSLHLHAHYGLWFTVFCVKVHDETSWREMAGDHNDKDKFSCLKMNTHHALKHTYLFDSFGWHAYDQANNRLGKDYMGGGSLKEHRIEASLGVACCLIGLITGIIGFATGKRSLLYMCVLALLISIALAMIPSIRLSRFSHQKGSMHNGIHMQTPYSAIATLVGCLLAFVTTFIAVIGLVRKRRQEAPGKWNKFNNELVPSDFTGDVKKPALVFLNEPLSEKPGLYDVCDFSDIKPAEECEVENNSIA